MKSLIQYKFEKYKLDISTSKYVYKLYNKNETIKNDEKLGYEGIGNSYVELPIIMNINTSLIQKYYIATKVNLLRKLSLEKNKDFSYFNKINDYKRDFFIYYHDKKNKNLKSIIRRTNIDNSSVLIEHQNRGFILNLNKKYENEFNNFSKNNLTFNYDDFSSSSNNIISNNNLGIEWFVENPNFTFGMIPIQERISYDFGIIGINQNNIPTCVGFFIEKYNDQNSLLTRKFIFNETLTNTSESDISSFENTIKDSYVKYGKKYKYVVYPTFIVSLPKQNDYHIIQDLLICDAPYIIDINCIETEKPEVPNKLLFKYTKENTGLFIEWSRPYNPENDIKGYYIFKRHSLEEPFRLIGVNDFTDIENLFQPSQNNIDIEITKTKQHKLDFIDKNYNPNKITIYTVCSFDAHGNFSNYSEQLVVLYDITRRKLLIDVISLANAPLHLPNIHIKRNIKYFGYQESIEDTVPIIKDKKKITLYCTPDFISIKNIDENIEELLKENYILNIFKLENQKSFSDIITIKNFKNINNN